MTVLVTGSNGFIGWHTCKRLIDQGADVIGVDDLSEGTADNAMEGVRYHTLSVADAGEMLRLMRDAQPEAVIHLAARPRIRFTVEQPLQSSTANLLGTIAVLDSLLRAELIEKTRFVFASSSAVYGLTDVLPTPETHPCDPQSPYALQKYQGEQWCRMFHRLYGLDVVSLRYFNVFGPGAAFGGAYSVVLSAWLYHLYVEPSYRPYLEGMGRRRRTRSDAGGRLHRSGAEHRSGSRLLLARRQPRAGGGLRQAARSRAASAAYRRRHAHVGRHHTGTGRAGLQAVHRFSGSAATDGLVVPPLPPPGVVTRRSRRRDPVADLFQSRPSACARPVPVPFSDEPHKRNHG